MGIVRFPVTTARCPGCVIDHIKAYLDSSRKASP
jgi:hypothetical protein